MNIFPAHDARQIQTRRGQSYESDKRATHSTCGDNRIVFTSSLHPSLLVLLFTHPNLNATEA